MSAADADNIIKATRARYVVLDGFRNQVKCSAGLQLCAMLVKERVAEYKVVLVRSTGFGSIEDYQANKVDSHEVYPWGLQQYLAAYANADFQESVKNFLDAGSDMSDMAPIHKKYYYAGSSAR